MWKPEKKSKFQFLFVVSWFPDLSLMSSDRRKPYPFDQIEPKWQAIWDERQFFHGPNPCEKVFDPAKPKFYVLDMFPYPSGAGLHVGHPEGYTATDIVARYKRMRGFSVLHPMGWDAFGLPAEQYAIKTGQHPAITTRENVAKFKSQLKRIGFLTIGSARSTPPILATTSGRSGFFSRFTIPGSIQKQTKRNRSRLIEEMIPTACDSPTSQKFPSTGVRN